MNKKGFTLIEVLSVLIIIIVIAAIIFPSVTSHLDKNRQTTAKNIEKLLISNLELYNTDNEEQLWQNTNTCVVVSMDDLLQKNPNIDLGECLLTNENALVIKKENESFKYSANITCGKNIKSLSTNKYIFSSVDKAYYKSTNVYRCN